MSLLQSQNARLPLIAFIALVIVYLVFEVLFFAETPSGEDSREIAQENIEIAASAFSDFNKNFEQENSRLSNLLEEMIRNEADVEHIRNRVTGEFDFWGSSVFINDSLMFWSGFPKESYTANQNEGRLPFSISILKDRNVVYMQGQKSFLISGMEESTRVQVTTLQRLKQKNTLKVGGNAEIATSDALGLELNYPVYFSFFDPVPENTLVRRDLLIPGSTQKGVIYTLTEDFDAFLTARANAALGWRFSFLVLILILGGILVIRIAPVVSSLYSFTVQSVTILIGWILFHWLIGFFEIHNLFYDPIHTLPIIRLGLNMMFAGLFTFSLVSFLKSDYDPIELFGTQSASLLALMSGFLSSLFVVLTLMGLYQIPQSANLSLLNLRLIPTLDVFLFYIFAGSLVLAILISIISLMLLCIRFSMIRIWQIIAYLIIGFGLGQVIWFYVSPAPAWLLLYALTLFLAVILITYFFWTKRKHWEQLSRLRMVIGACFIAALITYVPSINGEIHYQNQLLVHSAQDFALEEEEQIEEITISTLINLEQELSALELQNVQTQKSFLESFFETEAERQIRDEWQAYSFSIQLIDNNGDPLAEYTTNLNAPGWTKTFDIFSLEIPFEEERIRRDRLRPVIRKNPLERSSSEYSAYRQGWIPFFASPEDDTRLGWIISSVYKERPQYQKPFRAVISYANSDINATIHLDEFVNGTPNRSAIIGTPIEVPGYNALNNQISEQLDRSGEISRFQNINGVNIREYFLKTESGSIVRAAMIAISPSNHLYSVLRFFFSLLILAMFISLLFSVQSDFRIIGFNKRFKDRLLDRFILASMACLIALVAGATYTISRQNSEAVRNDLSSRLGNLSLALEESNPEDVQQVLFETASLLDADAILYSGFGETASTAPQIFTQNILPSQLPWEVYHAFTEQGSEEEIKSYSFGDLQLLLGFKPITIEGKIRSVVAIPTFVQAPMFHEQLLSTTSLLIALFVLIFGVFISAAGLIANQLTSPLEELNEGIKTISSGNLDMTLPVKSKDEIGALTKAYNIMLFRLKELQQNLVEAEREAAWKEMAQQVAHEIKNPLTPMKLNLQHLERQIKDPNVPVAELKDQISRINQNLIEQIESLSRIASDFSKFARPIEQEFKEINLNELLLQVGDLYSHEEHVELHLDIPEEKLMTSGVKEELRRVFINLIKNGIEAMPGGGSIRLKAFRARGKVVISVKDTGEGISSDNLNLVFIPNFSTKTSGTGLGLAIAKKIIEEHEGTIDFESKKDKGTTFIITLPETDT